MRARHACLLLLVVAAIGHCRETVCLNGEWDFLPLSEARLGDPPTGDWPAAKISVPSWWTAGEFEYPPEFRRARAAWYRRTFSVAQDRAGKRLWLRFGAVYYAAEVYVNGARVGGHYGGFSPFTLDITDAAQIGENDLIVGVIGWRAALKPDMRDTKAAGTREVPGDLIGPVGFFGEPGIWQDVFLEATGDVRIENVWVHTELKPSPKAIATVICHNAGEETVQIGVRGAVRPLPRGARYDHTPSELPKWPCQSAGLELAPGERAPVELVQLSTMYGRREHRDEEAIRLWWPGKPALYEFTVLLTDPDTRSLDQTVTRFGYREITWKGPSLFVNGVPIHLRGEGRCGWNSHQLMPEHVRGWYQMVQDANCNTVRLHAGRFSEEYLDIADELGIMTVVESAPLWCHAGNYDFADARFWENSKQQLTERVLAWRNHPSLIVWSVENELLMTGGHRFEGSIERIAELGDATKQLDPTRPFMYEGCGDVAGRADIVNLHYPYEYPRHTLWPNDAHWLSRDSGKIDTWPRDFLWRHEKPLVIGEFLSNWCSIPDWRSMFVGDAAYEGREGRRAAEAMAVRMQLEGYRWAGCTGIHPWDTLWRGVEWRRCDYRPEWPDPSAPGVKPRRITSLIINPGWLPDEPLYRPNIIFEEEKRAFSPQAAFIEEYDSRFYAGETVERTVVLLNDTLRPADMELRVEFPSDGDCPKPRVAPVRARLAPAERAVRTFTCELPRGAVGYVSRMALRLFADDKLVFTDELPFRVCAPPERLTQCTVALVDPSGEFAAKLRGALCDTVDYFDRSGQGRREQGIVAAPDALTRISQAQREQLREAVREGARLLILCQDEYPADFLPGVRLSDVRSTMTFPIGWDGRPLSSLRPGDLCFWRGDHLVTGRNFVKPTRGPFRPITQAGGYGGLMYTPLMEMRYGKGWICLCQMLVGEKLGREPAADLILADLLVLALSADTPDPAPAQAVCDPDGAFALALDDLGVAWEPLTGADGTDLKPARCLLIGPTPSAWSRVAECADEVRAFAEQGGNVLIHGVTPATRAAASGLLGVNVKLQPRFGFSATARRRAVTAELLLSAPLRAPFALGWPDDGCSRIGSGISSHDLYWIESESWDKGPTPSAEIAEFRLAPLPEGAREIVSDGLLSTIPYGSGQFVIDQIRWPEELGHEKKADRYASILLQNLGCEIGLAPRSRPVRGDFFTVDLRNHCNMVFADDVAGDGTGGWTDQGSGWDMARFPTGRQVLGGVPFEIIDPSAGEGRSCLVLHAPEHGEAFPKQVTGIPVARKAGTLHFLVSSAWSQAAKDGDAIAEITIHHEDGSSAIIPVRYGLDVIDWFYQPRRLENAVPAWIGANDVRDPIAVYRFAWQNPSPQTAIRALDIRSLDVTVPVLIAVTGDASVPSAGPEAAWEAIEQPLRLTGGQVNLTVTPTGALQIACGGKALFGDVALRLHNNEQGGWATLGSQWPSKECAMAAQHRRIGEVTEIRAEGQLGYLDVVQQANIASDGSTMLNYDCTVARPPQRPELVMGLLLNLTMPEIWAEGKGTHDRGAQVSIARDLRPTTGLGAGPGTVRWELPNAGLPAFDVGGSGRFNFFDSRRWSGGETPSYVLQLMSADNPTRVGARFTMRAAIMPGR